MVDLLLSLVAGLIITVLMLWLIALVLLPFYAPLVLDRHDDALDTDPQD